MSMPQKPPTLPEQPTPDSTPKRPTTLPEQSKPDDTPPHPPSLDDTQPKRVTAPLIPPPPKYPAPSAIVRRRSARRSSDGGWGLTLLIALLVSLLIALVFLVLFIIYLPPEYIDPFILGRLATRTQEAAYVIQTENAQATRAAEFSATQAQAAANVIATGTAVAESANQQATLNALSAQGTAISIQQTATGAALAFDATRTAVALEGQSTAAVSTLAALRFSATQTAAARPTMVRGDVAPNTQGIAPARATAVLTNLIFRDTFDNGLNSAWLVAGDWQVQNGAAFSTVCGTSLQVGATHWRDFAVDMTVQNGGGAQYAVTLGYGERGRLYVNFGLGGAVWWLVDGASTIPDQMQAGAYVPRDVQRVRVSAAGSVVTVHVDGQQVTQRTLPESVHGAVGVYVCPAQNGVPRFDSFTISGLN